MTTATTTKKATTTTRTKRTRSTDPKPAQSASKAAKNGTEVSPATTPLVAPTVASEISVRAISGGRRFLIPCDLVVADPTNERSVANLRGPSGGTSAAAHKTKAPSDMVLQELVVDGEAVAEFAPIEREGSTVDSYSARAKMDNGNTVGARFVKADGQWTMAVQVSPPRLSSAAAIDIVWED